MRRAGDQVQRRLRLLWGGTQALLERRRFVSWVDLLIVVALAGLLYGILSLAQEWTSTPRRHVVIDLSIGALPLYTFYSLSRGLLAYVLSLGFTLTYGYWAAKDRVAERALVPLLDILQSIPVLGFMPGLVLALVAAFPGSNVGLELASIIMIFTGQAWNMTFSFYHSLRSIPPELREAATTYRFGWWQRFKWLEVPFATMGLVWNSMMSMAGGWFFLMVTEAFRLGEDDYRVPGLGSYMSEAVRQQDTAAMWYGVTAMMLMIVALDQLLWRPVIVWAQKYRVEEGGYQEAVSSWFLNLLHRSRALAGIQAVARRLQRPSPVVPSAPALTRPGESKWAQAFSVFAFVALLAGLAYGAWHLGLLLLNVDGPDWGEIALSAGLTLARVVLSTAVGTVWALPAGLAIGLSPRLSRLLQPVVQVLASFPATILFPVVIAALDVIGVGLGWGSILLMLLGTQWYILFNVIAGAMAIPADLKEAARSYSIRRLRLFWTLYAPAVFPYLVTGWITAAGGAWNASIVSEYYETSPGDVQQTVGLGAWISQSAADAHFAKLAAGIVTMSLLVVVFNRLVWKRLFRLAEERFSLAK
jgi:NitT/TauT family transport system permease protein